MQTPWSTLVSVCAIVAQIRGTRERHCIPPARHCSCCTDALQNLRSPALAAAAQVAPLLGSSDEPRSAPDVSSYPLEPADTDSSDMPAPTGMATGPESGAPMGGGGDNDGEAAREGYVLLGSDSAQVAGGDVTDSAVPPQVRPMFDSHLDPDTNGASTWQSRAEDTFLMDLYDKPPAIDLSQEGACNLGNVLSTAFVGHSAARLI